MNKASALVAMFICGAISAEHYINHDSIGWLFAGAFTIGCLYFVHWGDDE